MRRAAVVGGGVIGGGWAARFALAGIDVDVFDPPEAFFAEAPSGGSGVFGARASTAQASR